jgi:RimJ/RimL family protein N-acetyltransferase
VGRRFESDGAYSQVIRQFLGDRVMTLAKSSLLTVFNKLEVMPYPLLTQRLSIEPLALADLESFVQYRQDPAIARFQSWDTTYSKEQAIELISSQAGVLLPAAGDWLQLGIHHQLTGKLLGDLAVHLLEEAEPSYEIGFTIAGKHQGQGFGSEAAAKLIDHLFDEAGASKVIAQTDSRNLPSIMLLTRLGFKQQTEKSFTEHFKGEVVKVDYFEIFRNKPEPPRT